MKKFGFTLAELTLTIAIVAVLSVVAAQALSNVKPDSSKVRVMLYNKLISDASQELLSTPGIYFDTNGLPSDLTSTLKPIIEPYNTDSYEGANKFKNLMCEKIGITNTDQYNDGSIWTFTDNSDATNNTGATEFYIAIDIKPDGVNCAYGEGATNCPEPDTFRYRIDKNGNVFGNDPLTQAYIANPLKLNDKRADRRKADEILAKQKEATQADTK